MRGTLKQSHTFIFLPDFAAVRRLWGTAAHVGDGGRIPTPGSLPPPTCAGSCRVLAALCPKNHPPYIHLRFAVKGRRRKRVGGFCAAAHPYAADSVRCLSAAWLIRCSPICDDGGLETRGGRVAGAEKHARATAQTPAVPQPRWQPERWPSGDAGRRGANEWRHTFIFPLAFEARREGRRADNRGWPGTRG